MRYLWAIAGLAVCGTAQATDWQYLTTGGSDFDVFVDTSSLRALPEVPISRPFPVRQIWVRSTHERDNTVTYRERRLLYRINCNAETSLTMSGVTYAPSGKVMDSYSVQDYDFRYEPLTPDTIGYAIMEYACGRRPLP